MFTGKAVLVLFSSVGVVVELQVLRSLSMIPGQYTCGLLALPQKDLPQVSEWCLGISVLVHWVVFPFSHASHRLCLALCVCACEIQSRR